MYGQLATQASEEGVSLGLHNRDEDPIKGHHASLQKSLEIVLKIQKTSKRSPEEKQRRLRQTLPNLRLPKTHLIPKLPTHLHKNVTNVLTDKILTKQRKDDKHIQLYDGHCEPTDGAAGYGEDGGADAAV